MGKLSRNGRILYYYEKMNKGRAVVFLHGFAENARIWNYINEDLPFSSISLDFPGFGNSTMMESISMRSLAAEVRSVIEKLQIKKPILIGHSMGGYVALAYGIQYPQETAAIALLNSHPFADNAERIRLRNKSIRFIKNHGTEKYVKINYDNLFYKKNGFLKNTIQYLIDMHKELDEHILISYLKAMRDRRDRTSFISEWNKPFLFLIGKYDPLLPLNKQLYQASLANISEIAVMNKSAHMSHFEERIKTRELIIKFINFVTSMES